MDIQNLVHELDLIWHKVHRTPQEALRQANQYYEQYAATGLERVRAKARIVSAGAHFAMLNLEQAMVDTLEALRLAELSGAGLEEAEACMRLAAIDCGVADYTAALADLDNCFKALRKTQDRLLEAAAFNNMGEVYRELEQFGEAQSCYEKAIQLAGEDELGGGLAIYLANRGLVRLELGDYEAAGQDFQAAEAVHRRDQASGRLADVLANQALLAARTGQPAAAEALFRAAIELVAPVNLKLSGCDIRLRFGTFLMESGRHDEAADQLERCREMFGGQAASQVMVKTLRAMARIEYERGRYGESAGYLLEADSLTRRLFNGDIQRQLAIFKIRHDTAQAMREAEQARAESEQLRRSNEALQRSYRLVHTVSQLGRTVTSSLNIDHVCRELYNGLFAFLDAPIFSLALYDSEKGELVYRLNVKYNSLEISDTNLFLEPSNLLVQCMVHRRDLVVNDLTKWQPAGIFDLSVIYPETRSFVCMPVYDQEEALGAMLVQSNNAYAYDTQAMEALQVLSSFVAVALRNGLRYEVESAKKEAEIYRLKTTELKQQGEDLERANDQLMKLARKEKKYKEMFRAWNATLEEEVKRRTRDLEQLAIKDGLTGLYNRRHVFELLDREFKTSSRYRRELCLVMADIDHFKLVNDTYGHRAGDQVLADVARCIKAGLRNADFVGRYGGEEFLIVLPETPLAGAYVFAERLRRQVAELSIGELGLQVTVSFGLVILDGHQDLLGFVEAADRCLYQAKNRGRNRVVCTQLPPDDVSPKQP
ncbi:MAG: hypothetical protein A2087_08215 [Spirochaetes bacterium GWD1_61_31]|nr:MAG: hypothetical protein A2Y37_12390 [Spirochaetes bacterium GWB1_60_80]OHD30168.1 MAG: hypothetical protein A2004_14255 [Spirochaetes bacterium GWC1_61_12]OHD39891.1 MAG: hypothetical protein A2087_08215 [Spirochaetes bacterium GWD1_61_31]OHD46392.1 MAG: hypothetical protein A2Y35_10030 [Spirochaetes bacterium GWE1_60_18]OHD59448.1 MAG: hypothetical protein A2Y32_09985 [Spirochaetes bacterium GWF1_60_12]